MTGAITIVNATRSEISHFPWLYMSMIPVASVVCVSSPFISKERNGKLFATTNRIAAA